MSRGKYLTWILASILIGISYTEVASFNTFSTSLRSVSSVRRLTLRRGDIAENIKILHASKSDTVLESINLQPIGIVSSVYRLCVGTPRQGLLAPNSRGKIDLYPSRISSDSILDLEHFSHLWVVFIFHLNSNAKVVEHSKQNQRQFPSKIAPPALGGKRVGIFATRSPHRPNPVGFTLCKIDRVVIPDQKMKSNNKESPYQIYISGIDLIDGTPVIDIKPYVPHYDSIGYMNGGNMPHYEKDSSDVVRVPPWVKDGLEKRRKVWFSNQAEVQLQSIMMDESKPLAFYGVQSGRDANISEALESVKKCISEVLAVDVRSRFQTNKVRKGKFKAEHTDRVKSMSSNDVHIGVEHVKSTVSVNDDLDDDISTQQIDRLLVKYSVRQHMQQEIESSIDTDGSGADDTIDIIAIEYVPEKMLG